MAAWVVPNKDRTNWRARYKIKGGQPVTLDERFDTEKRALKGARGAETQALDGDVVTGTGSKMLFSTYYETVWAPRCVVAQEASDSWRGDGDVGQVRENLRARRLRVDLVDRRQQRRLRGRVQPRQVAGARLALIGSPEAGLGLAVSSMESEEEMISLLAHAITAEPLALDRTVPILPMQEGRIERRSHDYYRHGTSTLFAALDIANGQVTAALKPKHRHQEFLAFLKQIERTYRHVVDEDGVPLDLHLVMDNYAAHKHKNVKDWLAKNPRFVVHFTPTHACWMNMVEIWFGVVERQAIRRGVFKSVKDLNSKTRAFIDGWNDRSHPFVWTKTADDILKKANRPTTSNSRH